MISELNNFLWGDSTLEQLVLSHNKISLTIHNDVCNKDLILDCLDCIGITEMICWDEIIIDRLFAVDHVTSGSAMLAAARQQYGDILPDAFCQLHICFINGVEIVIVCRDIDLHESYPV